MLTRSYSVLCAYWRIRYTARSVSSSRWKGHACRCVGAGEHNACLSRRSRRSCSLTSAGSRPPPVPGAPRFKYTFTTTSPPRWPSSWRVRNVFRNRPPPRLSLKTRFGTSVARSSPGCTRAGAASWFPISALREAAPCPRAHLAAGAPVALPPEDTGDLGEESSVENNKGTTRRRWRQKHTAFQDRHDSARVFGMTDTRSHAVVWEPVTKADPAASDLKNLYRASRRSAAGARHSFARDSGAPKRPPSPWRTPRKR